MQHLDKKILFSTMDAADSSKVSWTPLAAYAILLSPYLWVIYQISPWRSKMGHSLKVICQVSNNSGKMKYHIWEI